MTTSVGAQAWQSAQPLIFGVLALAAGQLLRQVL